MHLPTQCSAHRLNKAFYFAASSFFGEHNYGVMPLVLGNSSITAFESAFFIPSSYSVLRVAHVV